MSSILRAAGSAAISLCVFAAAVETVPTVAFASASVTPPASETVYSDPSIINAPATQLVPMTDDAAAPAAPEMVEPVVKPASLRELVEAENTETALSKDEECLAGAIYFEAKNQSLEGQHAVAEVILNRTGSGRFPSSICGVVYQPSQFSFIRGGRMPSTNRNSTAWHEAVAVARVALEDRWETAASDALFFHATHVSPRWRLKRVATIGNHIFYR